MPNSLAQATRNHYQDLVGRIGAGYLDYRWQRHPVSRSHYRQTRRSLEVAFGRLGPVAEMLEIGCGPGTWTDLCLGMARRLAVVDISSEMLKVLHERFAGAALESFCGDFTDPQLALPGGFDVVFSARALEYMDDKEAMVARSARLLKPGGWLLVVTKNPGWTDQRREARRRPAELIHSDWIGWPQLEAHYRRQGLEQVVTYPVCLGSYHWPLATGPGIRFCERLQRRWLRQPLAPGRSYLTESYLTLGRTPVQGEAL